MDSVCNELSKKLFTQAKKQLIFVRRVRSVKEIKDKLDDAYNQWLKEYINDYLKGDTPNVSAETWFALLSSAS